MDHSVEQVNCIGNFTVFNLHDIMVTIKITKQSNNSQSPKHQNWTTARHNIRYLLNHTAFSFCQLSYLSKKKKIKKKYSTQANAMEKKILETIKQHNN